MKLFLSYFKLTLSCLYSECLPTFRYQYIHLTRLGQFFSQVLLPRTLQTEHRLLVRKVKPMQECTVVLKCRPEQQITQRNSNSHNTTANHATQQQIHHNSNYCCGLHFRATVVVKCFKPLFYLWTADGDPIVFKMTSVPNEVYEKLHDVHFVNWRLIYSKINGKAWYVLGGGYHLTGLYWYNSAVLCCSGTLFVVLLQAV